jgi:3-dehydrosphinganine reductase
VIQPVDASLIGLAETLRSELLLYSVSVHIFFPGTIYSPGYIEENKTKPKITREIEGTDDGGTPEQVAVTLLRGRSASVYDGVDLNPIKGVQRGDFHITSDLLGNIFRSSTRGPTPQNNILMDAIYGVIGYVSSGLFRVRSFP